eukprot:CAMPEP_0183723094 /NCGR_PEP_ID=MMETSP0737-20130205/14813_1 /TAXON_ID=385413 /ORGANISM="Thalassiosira miniscula, Strain CCMP1093" /LENGTH=357 /DNA_ID=CAMNT_0025953345 /DNA_START=246 /DNA_END=1319 /DNA_ORIENTATION=-
MTPFYSSRCRIGATSMERRHFSSPSSQTKLAYEWIVDGKVVPQSKMEGVTAGEDGKEIIVFLHGLLGNAKNLRTPAKKLTQQLPHYHALLLDIRGHGNSSSSNTPHSQPHNFESCVQDIFDTLGPLGLIGSRSPTAICGHSLGGRIALQYSHFLCTTAAAASNRHQSQQQSSSIIEPPKQTWVLDSVPGRADPSVHGVLRAISSLPTPIPSKSWVVDTLIKEHKMNKAIAMWIATNLRESSDSFEWIFDLGIANELVENFTDQNIPQMIHDVTVMENEEDGSQFSSVQLVMAGKNNSWTDGVVEELQSIPSFRKRSSSLPSKVSLFDMHTLEKAGHWVHVDDLDGLLSLMVGGLQRR